MPRRNRRMPISTGLFGRQAMADLVRDLRRSAPARRTSGRRRKGDEQGRQDCDRPPSPPADRRAVAAA